MIVAKFFGRKNITLQKYLAKLVTNPQQPEKFSCGEYICNFALYYSMHWPMNFSKVSSLIINNYKILFIKYNHIVDSQLAGSYEEGAENASYF